LASSRAKRLQQSADLKAQAEHQKADRKFDEAAATLGRALALDRELFGEASSTAADTLMLLAVVHERREDWARATKAREEVLTIRTHHDGKDNWRAADARRAIDFTAMLRQLDADKRRALKQADARLEEVAIDAAV
jgi:hypothetical protein